MAPKNHPALSQEAGQILQCYKALKNHPALLRSWANSRRLRRTIQLSPNPINFLGAPSPIDCLGAPNSIGCLSAPNSIGCLGAPNPIGCLLRSQNQIY
ncbi:hypothetical protein ACFXTH_007965 [Malus domestica]